MKKQALSLYILLRRSLQHTSKKFPFFDRMVGDRLRHLESNVKPYELLDTKSDLSTREISVAGFRLNYRDEDASIATTIKLNGSYEPETVELFDQILQPNDLFVDIGANIGFYSLYSAPKILPHGKVYAFEPSPDTFQVLQGNIELNQREDVIQPHCAAISDHQGEIIFLNSSLNPESSRIVGDNEADDKAELIRTPCIDLDSFFDDLGFPPIKLVKIDVEGHELSVLRGMKKIATTSPDIRLILEFNWPHIRHLEIDPQEIFSLLQAYGFTCFNILHHGYTQDLSFESDLEVLMSLAKRLTINIVCKK